MRLVLRCRECPDLLVVEGEERLVTSLKEALEEEYVFGCPGCWRPGSLELTGEEALEHARGRVRTYHPRFVWLQLAYGTPTEVSAADLQGMTITEAWEFRCYANRTLTLVLSGGLLMQIEGGRISTFGRNRPRKD